MSTLHLTFHPPPEHLPNMRPRFTYRHQYDLDTELAAEDATAIHNDEASLTQQQYTDEVNLNVMVRRFGITDGAIPPGAFDPKLFGPLTDFGEGMNLKDVLDATRAATEMFDQLPADIKRRFRNEPGALLDFLQEPANHEEAVRLGLLQRDTPPAPNAPVVDKTP